MSWLRVLNVSDGEKERRARLQIEGVIGGFDFFDESGQTAQSFIRTVDALGELDEIEIDLNSPGGVVSDGVAIANYLIHHQASVTINVIGEAASIASVIFQAADPGKRHMALGTTMFVHDPLTIAIGDADDFRKLADDLDTVRDSIVSLFTRHGQMSADKAKELMRADTTMTAEQAVDSGVADTMDDALQAVACYMDHNEALEQARRYMTTRKDQEQTRANRKTYNGPQLASLLNDAIDAIDENEDDDRSRSDVVEEMGQQAGIDPSTVNSILNANIDCPGRERLEGFANVDGLPGIDAQIEAAESDGCEFGGDDDDAENRAQNCKPCAQKPAPATEVMAACESAGISMKTTREMVDAGITREQLKQRVNVAGKIQDICAAAGVRARADRYIQTGMSVEEVRADLWDLVVARDGEGTDNHVPTQRKAPLDTGDIYKNYNNQARQR